MPNVIGLHDADYLFTRIKDGASVPQGPHTHVGLDGTTLTVTNSRGEVLVTLEMTAPKPRIRAKLSRIDGDTITAVNAFLKPYGKVKQYWRTEEYRWHPIDGAPSPVLGKPVAPVAAPAAPAKTEAVRITVKPGSGKGVTLEEVVPDPEPEAQAAPTVTVPAVVHQATHPVIETVKRWQDRGGRKPTAKVITKTYSIVDDVLLPSVDVRRFDAMKRRRDAGQPAFGIITGPAGTAKTRFAQAWAFVNDLPVVIVEGQSIQTASDWFGSLVPNTERDGSPFVWEWSDAAKLILTGEPCLIVVDELNRPENERALNGLMGLTDWKATVKPVGAPHAVTLKPGQCLVATLNEGPEYVGTVEVDAAVRNRFSTGVRMDYTSEVIEVRILREQAPGIDKDVAKRLVRVAATQRAKRDDDTLYPSHNVISTRALVDIAQNITVGGLEPKEALWANLDSVFIPEDRVALNNIIEAQFGPDAVADTDDLAEDDEIEAMMVAHGL